MLHSFYDLGSGEEDNSEGFLMETGTTRYRQVFTGRHIVLPVIHSADEDAPGKTWIEDHLLIDRLIIALDRESLPGISLHKRGRPDPRRDNQIGESVAIEILGHDANTTTIRHVTCEEVRQGRSCLAARLNEITTIQDQHPRPSPRPGPGHQIAHTVAIHVATGQEDPIPQTRLEHEEIAE